MSRQRKIAIVACMLCLIALACGVTGVYLLAGMGWALINVCVGLLLIALVLGSVLKDGTYDPR